MTDSTQRDGYRIAIAGATGVVGRELMALLDERGFPIASLSLLASPRSAGTKLPFRGSDHTVAALSSFDFRETDIAFFSAGSALKDEARRAANEGALVIDNSSAFRRDANIPLVVPQINGHTLDTLRPDQPLGNLKPGIVANPNCSTILLMMVLGPTHRLSPVKRIVVSTYQAVSGSGVGGIRELEAQQAAAIRGEPLTCEIYPVPIYANAIPFVQAFADGDLTTEEWKLIHESRRILESPDLAVSATCVRVPVWRAHSESVNIEFGVRPSTPALRHALATAPGVTLVDEPDEMAFPTPRDANGKDDVLVGRIRRDPGNENAIDLWLCGDQIRKGAALNAIEIAEYVCGVGQTSRT